MKGRSNNILLTTFVDTPTESLGDNMPKPITANTPLPQSLFRPRNTHFI